MPRTSYSSPTFERSYDLLNAAQQRAVDTVEGPVMVIAGPGTGKTTILTLRIANILRLTDTAPDNILALTFTESGAHAMRRKLVETIGAAGYRIAIHTFHGFASQVIEQYPDYFPRIIGSSLITEAEQIGIIEKIIGSREIQALRPFGDHTYYVHPILRELQVLKRENISPAEFLKSVKGDTLPEKAKTIAEKEKHSKRVLKNTELAFVYKSYEAELARRKAYDFDDMLLELIRVMEGNKAFKLILQEQYQYILADEHQDANAAQNRILELLSDFHESPNLFIVGDDKQAIYRFQGASLENFLYFTHKYPDAVVIDLEHNYRSHQGILDASHSVIRNNPQPSGKERVKLLSLMVGSVPLVTVEFKSREEELEGLATLVRKLIGDGVVPQEIAILYRDNRHAAPIAGLFEKQGIPHRIESDHNILNDPEVIKITTLCQAIHNPADSLVLASALFLPEMECDPGEVAELCTLANREKKALYRIVREKGSKDIVKAYGRLVAWSRQAQTTPFPEFVQKLIQETGLLASVVGATDSLERLNSLQAFHDHITAAAHAARTFYLRDFMEYMTIMKKHGISVRRKYTDHVKGVRLMTAHRSKGLEFNHVFIVHVEDGVWGNRSVRNLFTIPVIEHARNSSRIEDDRRLFYVAMTRARDTVTITHSRSDGNKEAVPSQFIGEIDPSLLRFDKGLPGVQSISGIQSLYTTPAAPPQKTLSILEPDFVRSKFLSQPLSVTHLNNYLECPWRYFFVNLIRVPQAETRHQLYGTAIHATLRTFFDAYSEERDMTLAGLLVLFKHNLAMLPLSADDRDDSWTKGKKALEGYYKTYQGSWNRHLVTEYGIRGIEMSIEKGVKLELSGKLDKIEFLDDRHVVVVDYKTGKPKSRNHIEGNMDKAKPARGEGDYFRQLAFYKLLVDGEGKQKMDFGEIDFIEPNERGKHKKERFEVSSERLAAVKVEIVAMAKNILTLGFVNLSCDDGDCEYCRLGRMLLGKK